MAKKLNDEEKKKIIAYYTNCNNYSETARAFKISESGVRKIVKSDETSAKLCEQKKEENTQDMLTYLDQRKTDVQGIISKILKNLKNPELLESASAKEQATVMAILIDKFAGLSNTSAEDKGAVININFKDCSGKKDE